MFSTNPDIEEIDLLFEDSPCRGLSHRGTCQLQADSLAAIDRGFSSVLLPAIADRKSAILQAGVLRYDCGRHLAARNNRRVECRDKSLREAARAWARHSDAAFARAPTNDERHGANRT